MPPSLAAAGASPPLTAAGGLAIAVVAGVFLVLMIRRSTPVELLFVAGLVVATPRRSDRAGGGFGRIRQRPGPADRRTVRGSRGAPHDGRARLGWRRAVGLGEDRASGPLAADPGRPDVGVCPEHPTRGDARPRGDRLVPQAEHLTFTPADAAELPDDPWRGRHGDRHQHDPGLQTRRSPTSGRSSRRGWRREPRSTRPSTTRSARSNSSKSVGRVAHWLCLGSPT